MLNYKFFNHGDNETRTFSVFVILIFLMMFLVGCQYRTEPQEKNYSTETEIKLEEITLFGAYDVIRVVDGDTLVLLIDKVEQKVRLIGVDTPESVHSDSEKNTLEGKDAAAWLKETLGEKQVYVEYDVEKSDKYGRTLAYIYLDDGKTMLNRLLLSNGMAQVMTIQPNSKYADDFHATQKAARDDKAGFWETGYFN